MWFKLCGITCPFFPLSFISFLFILFCCFINSSLIPHLTVYVYFNFLKRTKKLFLSNYDSFIKDNYAQEYGWILNSHTLFTCSRFEKSFSYILPHAKQAKIKRLIQCEALLFRYLVYSVKTQFSLLL